MEPSEGRKVVEISSAEDEPLTSKAEDEVSDINLAKEKNAEANIDFQKFSLGSLMLGWCLILMFLCILLSFLNPDNELLKNGFEAFKLIVMTILGYIFGQNKVK